MGGIVSRREEDKGERIRYPPKKRELVKFGTALRLDLTRAYCDTQFHLRNQSPFVCFATRELFSSLGENTKRVTDSI